MKRSERVFEHIMTFGWAYLVVLIAIAALLFFGFSPSKQDIVNEHCESHQEDCLCHLSDERDGKLVCKEWRAKTQEEKCHSNPENGQDCTCTERLFGYSYLQVKGSDGLTRTFGNNDSNSYSTIDHIDQGFRDLFNISIKGMEILPSSKGKVIKCLDARPKNECEKGWSNYVEDHQSPFRISCQTVKGKNFNGLCTLDRKEDCDFWSICNPETIDWKDTKNICRQKNDVDWYLESEEFTCERIGFDMDRTLDYQEFVEMRSAWRLLRCQA